MTATLIHPQAVVDPKAELGEGVEVGPFAVIAADVEIGDNCRVAAGAQVQGPSSFGRENLFFPYACVGFAPQDLKFKGEPTRLEVGDGNHFREFCTVQRGTEGGGGLTAIGSFNLFMNYTHVAHDCKVGDRTIFSNNGTLAGHVEVDDDAVIGAFSSVHQFCRVGQHAYIGGYSVVTRDALPFVKTVGEKPACYGINRIGLQRKGFTDERIRALERSYRILVRSRQETSAALAKLGEIVETTEGEIRSDLEYISSFIRDSSRGVIKNPPTRKGERAGGRG